MVEKTEKMIGMNAVKKFDILMCFMGWSCYMLYKWWHVRLNSISLHAMTTLNVVIRTAAYAAAHPTVKVVACCSTETVACVDPDGTAEV